MTEVYGSVGIAVQLVSTENLSFPLLNDVDVGACTMGNTTAEQNQLFHNPNNAGTNDVVVYFVRSTSEVTTMLNSTSRKISRRGSMAVSMDDVRRVLDPEEPSYEAAAKLGTEALPHLQALVTGDDSMLAAKAAYAASVLAGATGEEVVLAAAQSADSIGRVAAAAAPGNLPAESASAVLVDLVSNDDQGISKVARAHSPEDASG